MRRRFATSAQPMILSLHLHSTLKNSRSQTIQLTEAFNCASGNTQPHFIQVAANGEASNARINRAAINLVDKINVIAAPVE